MIMPYVVLSTLPQPLPLMSWVNTVRETAEIGSYLSALYTLHFSAAAASLSQFQSAKEFLVIFCITFAD